MWQVSGLVLRDVVGFRRSVSAAGLSIVKSAGDLNGGRRAPGVLLVCFL
jgi:hypothetical protein